MSNDINMTSPSFLSADQSEATDNIPTTIVYSK